MDGSQTAGSQNPIGRCKIPDPKTVFTPEANAGWAWAWPTYDHEAETRPAAATLAGNNSRTLFAEPTTDSVARPDK